jgi:hypothetical protein
MPDEPVFATKEFVRDEVSHLKELMRKEFEGRDKAIELLASKTPLFVAVAGFLLALLAYLKAAH